MLNAKFKKILNKSAIKLGLITGAYLGFLYILFHDKILKIQSLELGQLGSFLGGVFAPILFIFIIIQHFSQQEQLLELREKEQEKEEEKKRLAQPTLEISNGNLLEVCDYSTEDSDYIIFNIANLGGDIKRAEISIFEKNKESIKQIPSIRNFDNPIEIRLKFKKFDLTDFHIQIRYLDSLNNLEKKYFKIETYHDPYCENIFQGDDIISTRTTPLIISAFQLSEIGQLNVD